MAGFQGPMGYTSYSRRLSFPPNIEFMPTRGSGRSTPGMSRPSPGGATRPRQHVPSLDDPMSKYEQANSLSGGGGHGGRFQFPAGLRASRAVIAAIRSSAIQLAPRRSLAYPTSAPVFFTRTGGKDEGRQPSALTSILRLPKGTPQRMPTKKRVRRLKKKNDRKMPEEGIFTKAVRRTPKYCRRLVPSGRLAGWNQRKCAAGAQPFIFIKPLPPIPN